MLPYTLAPQCYEKLTLQRVFYLIYCSVFLVGTPHFSVHNLFYRYEMLFNERWPQKIGILQLITGFLTATIGRLLMHKTRQGNCNHSIMEVFDKPQARLQMSGGVFPIIA